MTEPLALVVYEKLLPGSQLVNRLQDLNYRVQVVHDPDALPAAALEHGPMVVLADLHSTDKDVCASVTHLRSAPATAHLPVIVFADEKAVELQKAARVAGATLVVHEAALLSQLPQLLDQALHVE
jgi:CheY-like chemotaxis protein